MAQQSYKHHYVPEWYQKRFLAAGQTTLKILNLNPPRFHRPDGYFANGRQILDKGPSAFFFEKDLYTTRLFGKPNDDIERMLFGAIDRKGKRAIDAYLNQDWNTIHHTYVQMYEFMDALRLRTPKGLTFIKLVAGAKNQIELMYWMQRMRRMHCVMWGEGVLEILSAEDSSTKFIFSDHPVTLYNSHVFPGDPGIPASMDPLFDWMGTQTLFPFDQNHLFVITHLEWARSPGSNKARKKRTNARYFDNPILRYDSCIRNRKLSEVQVRRMNYILKARAHQYIAGRTEDDLFPERHLTSTLWSKLGQCLMPPKNELHHFGGEMTFVTKDGGYHFQDEYGRRPKTKEEYDKHVEEAKKMQKTLKMALSKHHETQKNKKL